MIQSLERYFQKYYRVCCRVAFTLVKNHADAEDVAQEVLLRLLVCEPEFVNEEHEKAWIIRTAINLCKDLLKSKWHKSTVRLEAAPEFERAYFQVLPALRTASHPAPYIFVLSAFLLPAFKDHSAVSCREYGHINHNFMRPGAFGIKS